MPLYTDLPGGATVATVGGPRGWQTPFQDVSDELLFTEPYYQTISTYAPMALDTPHPSVPGAYLVEEGPRENNGAFYKWTRTFSKIPPSRNMHEGYSWLVPGIGSGSIYAAENITSSSNSTGTTTLHTSASPTISTGDEVSVSYTFTDSTTGTQYGRVVLRTALSGTSGTTIVVALISEPGGNITYQTLKKVEPGRAAEALEVGSALQLDYFLPGVSAGISTIFDIPIVSALEIYDGTGTKTNSFTASTSPTLAWWRSQVSARAKVCVVRSVLRRWKGNIIERATRYCIAQ